MVCPDFQKPTRTFTRFWCPGISGIRKRMNFSSQLCAVAIKDLLRQTHSANDILLSPSFSSLTNHRTSAAGGCWAQSPLPRRRVHFPSSTVLVGSECHVEATLISAFSQQSKQMRWETGAEQSSSAVLDKHHGLGAFIFFFLRTCSLFAKRALTA